MLENIYNQKVTILNKLRRADTPEKKEDLWFKTVVTDAAWYTDSARSAGSSSVFIGTYITVLLPFHEEYVPYLEWKDLNNKDEKFTISMGDYIILGEIEEEVTAANVVAVMQKYGENVCLVRHHKASYPRFGATVQLKIEGV